MNVSYVRFPLRIIYISTLFILSSVTVCFPVRNGFGVSWRACPRNLKRFWSLGQGHVYYLRNVFNTFLTKHVCVIFCCLFIYFCRKAVEFKRFHVLTRTMYLGYNMHFLRNRSSLWGAEISGSPIGLPISPLKRYFSLSKSQLLAKLLPEKAV